MTSRSLLVLAIPICLPIAVACRDPSGVVVGDFHGHFATGFEVSSFSPCGENESWWTFGELDAVYEFLAPLRGHYQTAFVSLRGEVTEKGSYGPMGGYERQLRVTAVLQVRDPTTSDCS